MTKEKYVMTISRTTVDKLGIKLYDKVSLAVGELVANSYDADAEKVTIRIPLNKWLATRSEREIVDQGFEISVEDDGNGMPADLVNDFYLKVGNDPRKDPKRGPFSLKKKRPRMGRKGIGKLAPFGICKIIEVQTAGGKKTAQGYKVAHFIMNYDEINQETDAPYYPKPGANDNTYSQKAGTTVKLRNFLHRRTPDRKTFHRQLAKIFGLQLPDFKIEVVDAITGEKFVVGQLKMNIEKETKIELDDRPVVLGDGTKLPVRGWVSYSKHPYKNAEVAGVRIYARRRIVSSTRDFGLKAGFTGEHTIRSYLIGEIHADWLDKDDSEDLVHTGRQDILWESEIGDAFEKWGQALLKDLGKKSWSPRRERTWKTFLEKSDFESDAWKRYKDKQIVEKALELGKIIGRGLERDDLGDNEYINGIKEVCLMAAPHILHVESLKEVEKLSEERPLEAVIKLFEMARIGERASLGQVALERIEAINKLETKLLSDTSVGELELQQLLEESPWIINPEWTLLSANETFETMRKAFEKWYKKTYKVPIKTTTIGKKERPDFVMLHVRRHIEIVEIKKPEHALTDEEFDKVLNYYAGVEKFLDKNSEFKTIFPGPHISLVCDDIKLDAAHNEAYLRKKERGELIKKTWPELLSDTKNVHEAFLTLYHKGR